MKLVGRRELLRGAAAAACAVTLWLAELAGLARESLREDVESLARASTVSPDELRASGPAFAFDPDYAAFLAAVRDRTPPDAVVALSVPRTHELYTYDAWYVLAPRRLVLREDAEGAQFVAARGAAQFVAEYRAAGDGDAIPHGRLRRLR